LLQKVRKWKNSIEDPTDLIWVKGPPELKKPGLYFRSEGAQTGKEAKGQGRLNWGVHKGCAMVKKEKKRKRSSRVE